MTKRKDKPSDFISVVVLTHNRKYLLYCCLQSLFNQVYPQDRFEILVVDDGSTDATKPLVESLKLTHPNLQYSFQSRQGVSVARNRGIQLSRGHVIAFVADDYVLPPDYLNTISHFFRVHGEPCAIRFLIGELRSSLVGRASYLYYRFTVTQQLVRREARAGGGWLDRWKSYFVKLEQVTKEATYDHFLDAAGGAAYRREVFDRVGLFQGDLKRGEDTDMAARLRRERIPLFFDPGLVIGCRFPSRPAESMRYYFEKGYWFQNYMLSRSPKTDAVCCVFVRGTSFILAIFRLLRTMSVEPVCRSWQACSVLEFVMTLPIMFLFVGAFRSGMLWRSFQNRQGREGISEMLKRGS